MKFRRTPQFIDDFAELNEADKEAAREAFKIFQDLVQGIDRSRNPLRLKKMQGHSDIWEGHVKINLCFTYHIEKTEEGETIYWFRRIGTHDIYQKP